MSRDDPPEKRFTRVAPTIRDVAARAGVPTATVSNVPTGRRQVAESRRRLVLEAVAALGYQPDHSAASLRRRHTRTVGIVVPDLTNPFFAALVQRIEERAALDDYHILLVDSSHDAGREAARTRALLARRIDGLILAPTQDALPAVGGPGGGLPPTVLLDRGFGLAGFDTVAADNSLTLREAVLLETPTFAECEGDCPRRKEIAKYLKKPEKTGPDGKDDEGYHPFADIKWDEK